jgi:hypothetical protein
VSGTDWLDPFLALLLEDPYSAVRWVAYESLKKSDAFRDLPFDFVGSPGHRRQTRESVLHRWKEWGGTDRTDSALLLRPDGSIDTDAVAGLRSQRNDRPVRITE